MLREYELPKLNGVSISLNTTLFRRGRPVRGADNMVTDEASVTNSRERVSTRKVKLKGRLKESKRSSLRAERSNLAPYKSMS